MLVLEYVSEYNPLARAIPPVTYQVLLYLQKYKLQVVVLRVFL